jgi:hypothetical protein
MCGVCGSTGVLLLNSTQQGSGGLTVNPDAVNQTLVIGPDYTGPRKTYVNADDPTSWPPWITAVNGAPIDTGAPGGTFQAQPLPDLFVTGFAWWWIPLAVLGVLVLMKARKG